jgi:hypothetical protein
MEAANSSEMSVNIYQSMRLFCLSVEAQASGSQMITSWNTSILPTGLTGSNTEIKKWCSFSNLKKKYLLLTFYQVYIFLAIFYI